MRIKNYAIKLIKLQKRNSVKEPKQDDIGHKEFFLETLESKEYSIPLNQHVFAFHKNLPTIKYFITTI